MYCVKCGVRLQDGVHSCPLCKTPVICPGVDQPRGDTLYSQRYPDTSRRGRYSVLALLTALAAALMAAMGVAFFQGQHWGGYVVAATALVYLLSVLPCWFRHPHPMIFVPLSFVEIALALLAIDLLGAGGWFLTFALPVVVLLCVVTTAGVALFRYVRRGRLFIVGGLFLAVCGCSMLVELFQHITFHTPMFRWSLYTAGVFFLFGMFFILAGIIRPMREYLERKFFF